MRQDMRSLVDGTIDDAGNVTSGMINSVAGGAEATSFIHTGLQYDTTHTYYIRAVNAEWAFCMERDVRN